MGGIFINYRSGSHDVFARVLYERLVDHFGADRVFLDRPSIHAGGRYPDDIRRCLLDADVLIAVIHEQWLTEQDAAGERLLDRAQDWVRKELEMAFAADKQVVPVLTGDARQPDAAELPSSIADLAHRQSRHLHGDAIGQEIGSLIDELEHHVAPSWSPHEVSEEPPARTVRPLSGFPLGVAALLLVIPVALVTALGGHPSSGDTPPLSIYLALYSIVAMLVRLVSGIPAFLLQRRVNSWERETQAMAPMPFYRRIGIPAAVLLYAGTAAIVIGGAISSHLPRLAVYGVIAAVVLVLFVSIVPSMIAISRDERADEERATHWPVPLPMPVDTVTLRREVVRLTGKLSAWRAPLSREQSDKAEWAVRAILENTAELRLSAAGNRRSWLVEDHPRRLVRYLWWMAGTVGVLAAAIAPRIGAHLISPFRGWVTILAGAVAVLLIMASILEMDYRRLRLRARVAAEDVTHDVERLAGLLTELRRPQQMGSEVRGAPPT